MSTPDDRTVEPPPLTPLPWLVVIDMQNVFGDPTSAWLAPRFDEIVEVIERLVAGFGERVVWTRFIPPAEPLGAWQPYYKLFPWALERNQRRYELSDSVGELVDLRHHIVDEPRFGKWGQNLAAATQASVDLVLVGVATDCCVLSTALAAGDAGVAVRVVEDGCAGSSDEAHQRALAAMALYDPLVKITTAAEVLDSLVYE